MTEQDIKQQKEKIETFLYTVMGNKFTPDTCLEQVEKSLKHLEELKKNGMASIKSIIITEENVEQERESQHEKDYNLLGEKLEEEKRISTKIDGGISLKWGKILSGKDPIKIKQMIEEQEHQCNEVMRSKDGLVKELRVHLKEKDQTYISSLMTQIANIDLLCARMRDQLGVLTKSHAEKMEIIENTYRESHAKLLETHWNEVEEVILRRSDLESSISRQRRDKMEFQENELERLIDDEMETFAVTKKEKDEKCHDLERSLDQMRGKFELNAEKLKYYYLVLQERFKENKKLCKSNQAEIAKLIDEKTRIRARYTKDEREFKQKNLRTTEQYNRLAKQYRALLKKFKFFESADSKKFDSVWKMNERICAEKVNELINLDKFIEERILGRKYQEIRSEFFFEKKGKKEHGDKGDEGSSPLKGSLSSRMLSSGRLSQQESPTKDGKRSKILNATELTAAKVILEQLCDETSFMLTSDAKKVVETVEDDEEKYLLKLNHVLEAFGINEPNDVDELIQFFIEANHELFDKVVSGPISLNEIKIPSDQIVAIIKQFVREKKAKKVKKGVSSPKTPSKKKKKKFKEEESKHWERMRKLISEEKLRLWKVLSEMLSKYGKVLKSRERVRVQNRFIEEENIKLNELLQDYMSNKINDELVIPPSL